MSREKLKKLGVDLPMLPTTSVGSFPKPDFLEKARSQFTRGKIDRAQLKQMEDEATGFWMKEQERLGVDILVDGEMYRGDMVAFFADGLGGFSEKTGLVRSYGNRYYYKPIVVGPIQWKGPMTVNEWKFAQAMTKRPVKGMLTGAYTIMDWSFDEHYPDRRACALAIAREMRQEVDALIAAGCKIIQIDEPAISCRLDEIPVAIEAMDLMTRGAQAYFLTHICYGAFEHVYPKILELPVDNIDLDMAETAPKRLPAIRKSPFTRDISYGVADVHSHKVESVEVVAARVREALSVLKPEQVWIDPDCGLKTRQVDEAVEKMRVIVEATQQVRKEKGF